MYKISLYTILLSGALAVPMLTYSGQDRLEALSDMRDTAQTELHQCTMRLNLPATQRQSRQSQIAFLEELKNTIVADNKQRYLPEDVVKHINKKIVAVKEEISSINRRIKSVEEDIKEYKRELANLRKPAGQESLASRAWSWATKQKPEIQPEIRRLTPAQLERQVNQLQSDVRVCQINLARENDTREKVEQNQLQQQEQAISRLHTIIMTTLTQRAHNYEQSVRNQYLAELSREHDNYINTKNQLTLAHDNDLLAASQDMREGREVRIQNLKTRYDQKIQNIEREYNAKKIYYENLAKEARQDYERTVHNVGVALRNLQTVYSKLNDAYDRLIETIDRRYGMEATTY